MTKRFRLKDGYFEVWPLFGPSDLAVKVLQDLGFPEVRYSKCGTYLLVFTQDRPGRAEIEALGWRVVIGGDLRPSPPFVPGCIKPGGKG
jgi:hypothetical protein